MGEQYFFFIILTSSCTSHKPNYPSFSSANDFFYLYEPIVKYEILVNI